MNSDEILSIQSLSVEYRKTHAKICNINFAIHKGEVLGLIGESGSGKSTICKAVLGLFDENSVMLDGSITLCGQEILPLCWYKRHRINGKNIVFIMQNPMTAFNPCMKIKDHFAETLCAHLMCSKKDAYVYGLDILKKVGLHDGNKIMKSYPFSLSGGMLQRIMIAIAIALKPVLIIADEPTTAIDTVNKGNILDLLTFVMKKYQPAMLLVSHDMEVIAAMADRVAIIKDGCILEEGLIGEVMKNPKQTYTKELVQASAYMGVIDCWK